MRHLALGLALISVPACGSVSAGEAQAPNSSSWQTMQKSPSPGQIHPAKKDKQVSGRHSSGQPQSLPLSAAESYASEHAANARVSAAAKPAVPAGNSWTGFYIGAGAGAARQ